MRYVASKAAPRSPALRNRPRRLYPIDNRSIHARVRKICDPGICCRGHEAPQCADFRPPGRGGGTLCSCYLFPTAAEWHLQPSAIAVFPRMFAPSKGLTMAIAMNTQAAAGQMFVWAAPAPASHAISQIAASRSRWNRRHRDSHSPQQTHSSAAIARQFRYSWAQMTHRRTAAGARGSITLPPAAATAASAAAATSRLLLCWPS